MELKERLFEIEKLEWDGAEQLTFLKSELDRLEKLGATEIHIDAFTSYDCAYLNIKAYSRRLETKEEYEERIKQQQERTDRIKQMDLATYNSLLEKYPELKK